MVLLHSRKEIQRQMDIVFQETSVYTTSIGFQSDLYYIVHQAKQYHPSAGRVTYNLSIHDEPCRKKKNHIHHINASEFTTTVTYSAVDVSIFAFNIVGRTPSTALLVPAIHKKSKCVCVMCLIRMSGAFNKHPINCVCYSHTPEV